MELLIGQIGHHSDNEDISPSSGSGSGSGSGDSGDNGHLDIKCSTGEVAGVVCQSKWPFF